jgi:hypothetical protein
MLNVEYMLELPEEYLWIFLTFKKFANAGAGQTSSIYV